jgi:DNA processing protein
MKIKTLTLVDSDIPQTLAKIPSPPRRLFYRGAPLARLIKRPRVAIVGTRNPSSYGKQVTGRLARELAEQGAVVVSGLALGVDTLAHRAALDAGGLTIAVLPGSVDKIYPRTNHRLGEEILAKGGALISEYDSGQPTYPQNFIARNRLVAGLAQAVLITEAGEESGSLHTARFAHKQGRRVLVVPGQITSKLSVGTNELLKSGAAPVTECEDVLRVLGLARHQTPPHQVRGSNDTEQTILNLLLEGINSGDELLIQSQLDTAEFNQALTMLEISGKIHSLGANHWSLR